MLSHFSHVQLFVTLWTIARQAHPSKRFSRQEYWSGLPCPPPEDLPNPGIKTASFTCQCKFFTTSTTWEARPEAPVQGPVPSCSHQNPMGAARGGGQQSQWRLASLSPQGRQPHSPSLVGYTALHQPRPRGVPAPSQAGQPPCCPPGAGSP